MEYEQRLQKSVAINNIIPTKQKEIVPLATKSKYLAWSPFLFT